MANRRDLDEAFAELIADDSAALAHWKDRLSDYVDSQGALDALRLRSPDEPPWPAADNPMLGYLAERALEMAVEEGLERSVAWLSAHAWFEGAIAERSRITRLIDTE